MAKAKKSPHRGSAFEDFLKEEGLLEQATATAMKRVLVWQEKRTGTSSRHDRP
jgi:hypothetical protein